MHVSTIIPFLYAAKPSAASPTVSSKFICFTAILATLSNAAMSPVQCQEPTGDGPLVRDCQTAFETIGHAGGTTCHGPYVRTGNCKEAASYGTCKIVQCGAKNDGHLAGLTGNQLLQAADAVLNDCEAHGHAQGSYHFADEPTCNGWGRKTAQVYVEHT